MKENNGFTLIELLAVIALIALLSVVIVPSIIGLFNKNKLKIDDVTKKLLFSATEDYLDANQSEYIKAEGAVYCPKLSNLIDNGFLEENLINVTSGENLDPNLVVKSSYSNHKYSYELVGETDCSRSNPDTSKPFITIGNITYKVGDNDVTCNTSLNLICSVYSNIEREVKVQIAANKIKDNTTITLKVRRGSKYVNWFDKKEIKINSNAGEFTFTIPKSAEIGEYVIEITADKVDKATKNFSIKTNPIILFMGD